MANGKILAAAALAGIAMGLSSPATSSGQDKNSAGNSSDVKCYGVNECAAHAGCGVKKDDVAAVKLLLGEQSFTDRFDKTKVHSCQQHASCSAAKHVLNWTSVSADECKQKSGIVIEETNGKKVAKKL